MKTSKIKTLVSRPVLIAIIAVAVIAALSAAYLLTRPDSADEKTVASSGDSINYGPPSADEKKIAEQKKEEVIKAADPAQTPTPDPSVVVTIVRATQSAAGADLNIRAIVDGLTSGECSISVSKSGQPTVTKTFPIAFEATTASCQNANVPAASFSAPGAWTVSVTASGSGKTSAAATVEATITQ